MQPVSKNFLLLYLGQDNRAYNLSIVNCCYISAYIVDALKQWTI